jgi:putative addiction module component (TIGR02574 family)
LPQQGIGGRLVTMSNGLREELFKLTTAERLELVEELWDSIAAERENEPFPLSEAQREELDRRLRELDEHPERARPWEEVRRRLWARKRE